MAGGRAKLTVLAAVLGAFTVLAVLLATGVFEVPSSDDVSDFLTETGAVGPIVFVVSMWAFQPLGVPGFTWMVPAGLVWPWPLAIALSWIGNMVSSTGAVAFARWTARDWVQSRIPERVRRYETMLSDGGLWPVIVLRTFTGQFVPADWLVGITRLPWRTILVGTAIGILPGIAFFVLVGGSLFEYLADTPGPVRWALITVLVAGAVTRRVISRRRVRSDTARTDEVASSPSAG